VGRVSIAVSDADLSLIDRVAGDNRSAFVIAAAVAEAKRKLHELEDIEIERLCMASADRDREVADEFRTTVGDGL